MRRAGRAAGERGFTLIEVLVVLGIIGVVVLIAIPNMVRARTRSLMLSQMKQVRQAAMMTRIDAIKGGRQSVLGFTTELGRPALIAWRDDDGDETRDSGEHVIGRWTFSERVTIGGDPTVTLKSLDGGGEGVVFLANGAANPHGDVGEGQGAFLVTDFKGNRFQVRIQGGAGTVTEQMWDGNGWSDRFVHWRY